MVTSMTFIIIVYLLANVAYLTALTPEEILSSDAVAATFALRVLKGWSWTIWIFVAMSAAGNLNGQAFARSRMYFVAAREGYLPEVMSMIHVRWRAPLPAMAITLPISLLLLLVGDLYVLIEFMESVDLVFTVITMSIIPYFRWKQPDRPASYKVPLFMPIVYILFNAFVIVLTLYSSPVRSTIGLVVTLIGFVFYVFGCKWTNKPYSVQNAIGLIIFINSVSVPASSHLQNILTVAKLIGLGVLITAGAVLLFQGHTDNFNEPFTAKNFNPALLPGAFYSGIFAYSGWDYITYVTEEVKKPEKTLLAMVTSLTFIIIVYLLANVAYLTALTPEEILSSDAVAATFAVRVLKGWSWTIWIFVAMSAAGNLNGQAFTRTRMYFVAAREGYLPEIMSMIHLRWRTPLPAMTITLPVSLLLLFVRDVFVLIELMELVDIVFSVTTVAIIPYFRWKQADRPASYKVPLFMPIVFILFNTFVILLSFYSSPIRSTIGLVVTLIGLVFYFCGCEWTKKPKSVQKAIDSSNIFLQKLFFSVRQEVKTY